MMRFVWIILLLVACPTPDTSSALTASDISYNNQNVAIALSNLEAQLLVEASKKTVNKNEDLVDEVAQLQKDLGILQEELTHIRTLLDQVQEGGIAHAKLIPFDPRVTTLKAQTLQEAIDEMMQRVSLLESNVLDDLGEPGPGLFEIPKDKKGKQGPNGPDGQGPGGPPPNGGGGPGGPPPNGGGGPGGPP
jgi:hypothetical protein